MDWEARTKKEKYKARVMIDKGVAELIQKRFEQVYGPRNLCPLTACVWEMQYVKQEEPQ